MSDEQMVPALRSWLVDTEAVPADVRHSAGLVMARVETARQRGRWWPLPSFGRSDGPAARVPRPQSASARGFTMFSALKFVTAGVIVALFGGMLLSGVFTAPRGEEMVPAAATASGSPDADRAEEAKPAALVDVELLPGVILPASEFAPGIWQVDDDVAFMPELRVEEPWTGRLIPGLDGSLSVATEDGLLRIGEDKPLRWKTSWAPGTGHGYGRLAVGPDGTFWLVLRKGVISSDGDTWTVRAKLDADERERASFVDLEVTADGSVWVAKLDEGAGQLEVLRFDGAEWQSEGTFTARLKRQWADSSGIPTGIDPLDANGGDVVLATDDPLRLYRHDGAGWTEIEPPEVLVPLVDEDGWLHSSGVRDVKAGPDGKLWLDTLVPPCPGGYCRTGVEHYDGASWQGVRQHDERVLIERSDIDMIVPSEDAPELWFGIRAVSSDGGAWSGGEGPWSDACAGIERFDGLTRTHHLLGGLCAHTLTATRDGNIWVFAGPRNKAWAKSNRLYVITPQALTASE